MQTFPSQQALPPFSCVVSPDLPALLHKLNCTLVISTYQAGKVIFIGLNDQQQLIQLPRNFQKAMGIAIQGDRMAIASQEEVIVLTRSQGLAYYYPKQPRTYDYLYMPRAKYFTGRIDIHDLDWGDEGLWGVNTSFSCLCLIDDHYSFRPQWQPRFIRKLEHDDFCHLNGMAMQDGKPRYVTALGQTTTPRGWKDKITQGGCLIDVASDEIILENLAMPHSPRIYDGKLYALLSASGEVICIDPQRGSYEVVVALGTFIRGMSKHGDYLFVGRSRLRRSSSSFAKLKNLSIGQKSDSAGITVVHLPTGRVAGELTYQNAVEEIYDIQLLPDCRRPGILNTETEAYTMGISTPTQTYWAQWDEPSPA